MPAGRNGRQANYHHPRARGGGEDYMYTDNHYIVSGSSSKKFIIYTCLITFLGTFCGVLHGYHCASVFELSRNFSHLSMMEQEMVFESEMGLYYSYYKTMFMAVTAWEGLESVLLDNRTEYPNTINAMQRFNLYPEIVLGFLFRGYRNLAEFFNFITMRCHQLRAGLLQHEFICEGIGNPQLFYLEGVFFLAGLEAAVLFWFGTYFSETILGGLLTILCFIYNHDESTRVFYSPILRESFGFPFFMVEFFYFFYLLRSVPQLAWEHVFWLACSIAGFMLPWQFAQYALLTQILAAYGTYLLGFISRSNMQKLVIAHGLGLLITFGYMMGNMMLLTSFYAPCLLIILLLLVIEDDMREYLYNRVSRSEIFIMSILMFILFGNTILLKLVLTKVLGISDDAHIYQLLLSKFTSFENFHTGLFNCGEMFDYIGYRPIERITSTYLLPSAAVGAAVLLREVVRFVRWEALLAQEGRNETWSKKNQVADHMVDEDPDSSLRDNKPYAEIVYFLLQLLAFTFMAIIVMRLKLFWIPCLCLLSSVLASKLMNTILPFDRFFVVIAIVGLMSVPGFKNVLSQYNHPPAAVELQTKEMLHWIETTLPQDAVMAGPMSTMAQIKLVTGRRIINHPHYENADVRARTKNVYTLFSRKPKREVWQRMIVLNVDYAVMELMHCKARPRPGCGIAELYDLDDLANRDNIPVCGYLSDDPSPYFEAVFRNHKYHVLKVKKTDPMKNKNSNS